MRARSIPPPESGLVFAGLLRVAWTWYDITFGWVPIWTNDRARERTEFWQFYTSCWFWNKIRATTVETKSSNFGEHAAPVKITGGVEGGENNIWPTLSFFLRPTRIIRGTWPRPWFLIIQYFFLCMSDVTTLRGKACERRPSNLSNRTHGIGFF